MIIRARLQPYQIRAPEIKSGADYYFETESGLRYQVLFARKKKNYLEHIVNFSVLSDEFEDEYSETNRGEIYRVIATVVEIIRLYHHHHSYATSYEFSGEFKKGNESRETSIRTLLVLPQGKGNHSSLLGHRYQREQSPCSPKETEAPLEIIKITGAAGFHNIRTIHIHKKVQRSFKIILLGNTQVLNLHKPA